MAGLIIVIISFNFQEKAYEEQESIFQGSDRAPTMKDLNEMKYLERVVKETLRIFPSVPIISRKVSSDTKLGKLHKTTNNFTLFWHLLLTINSCGSS